MPIHEFQCTDGHVNEEICTPHNIPEEIKCKCGKKAKRIMSSFNFDFKNLPKIIDNKRNRQLAEKRERLAEENHKHERGH